MNSYINQIIVGDALDILKMLPNEFVDITITSPPYNVGIQYDNYNDKMDINDYYHWCNQWIKEIYRVTKDKGRFILIHCLSCGNANKRFSPFSRLLCMSEDAGFKHHGIAIWEDRTISKFTAWGSFLSSSAPYINSPYEAIGIMYKNEWKRKGETGEITKEQFIMGCSGIWKVQPEHNRTHPAPFPVKLAKLIITLLTNKEDIILDPFIGSGTTAIAACELGRKFIGIEISPKYASIAKERIAAAKSYLFKEL